MFANFQRRSIMAEGRGKAKRLSSFCWKQIKQGQEREGRGLDATLNAMPLTSTPCTLMQIY